MKNTKIIDTHIHIGGEAVGFNMSEAMVEQMMDKYNISYGIISNCDCVEFDHNVRPIPMKLQVNQMNGLSRTINFARKNPNRYGVAPFIKPYTEGLTQDFRKYIIKNKDIIKAIKLHAFHSNSKPTDKTVIPYIELAEQLNIPVVSHTGSSDSDSPIHMYEAARMFPNVSFVMVHMGLGTDNTLALDLLEKADNLYGDTTWVPISTTIEAIKRYGNDKIMFGSDAPIDGVDTYKFNGKGEPSLYQQYFNDLPDIIGDKAYEALMHGNAERIFGI